MPIGTIQKYDATKRSRKDGIIISPAIYGVSEWNLDTPLSISSYGEYTITPQINLNIFVKMWGAGGGNNVPNNAFGGGGGYSEGTLTLQKDTQYKIIVGQAGNPVPLDPTAGRSASSGGGGSALLLLQTSNVIPLIVAGAGGGVYIGVNWQRAGAGGGLSGQDAYPFGKGGHGGTQLAPGAGGISYRRTGNPGSGINGGNGAGRTNICAIGGLGYGQGGAGMYDSDDAGSGGGGGGYFGGGGGGGDTGAYPGGGGSGYINTQYVLGLTETGNYSVPARSDESDRGTAGNSQTDGKIIISLA